MPRPVRYSVFFGGETLWLIQRHPNGSVELINDHDGPIPIDRRGFLVYEGEHENGRFTGQWRKGTIADAVSCGLLQVTRDELVEELLTSGEFASRASAMTAALILLGEEE